MKLEREQAEKNKRIVNVFETEFNFCRPYYFFSDYSNELSAGEFDKVVFIDKNLDPNDQIKFSGKNFLVAEFGNLSQEPSKYLNDYMIMQGDDEPKRQPKYYSGTDFGFQALVLKSDRFIQLRKPFPYYTGIFPFWPIKRKEKKVVWRMNKKLSKFYRNMQRSVRQ